MESLRVERLKVAKIPGRSIRKRIWREWCFARAIVRQRGSSLLLLVAIVLAGGWLFRELEPDKHHTFVRSMYFTWSLTFGQQPEEFPTSPFLQLLFFAIPLVGLTVIVEAVVEVSHMIRDRKRNEETWCTIMAESMKDHIILVGLGRLGIRTFHLLRNLGHDVVVIERNANAQFLDEVRRDGSPLFIADARREAWLVDVNVESARSIILATTDDLANLEIALDARRLNPKIRVVMRMFDPNMADKVREGFQIRTVMSAASLAAPAFAMAALERGIVTSSVVDDHLIVSLRWTADASNALAGRTIGEIMTERAIGIVEHRPQGGEPKLFPPPATRIAPGDELLVQGTYEALIRDL